jgi:hypothetical protein
MQRITIKAPKAAWQEWLNLYLDRATGMGPDDNLTIEAFDLYDEVTFKATPMDRYVMVEYLDPHPVSGELTRKEFCYRDPWGSLQVGDLVDAPTVYEEHNRAIVRRVDVRPPGILLGKPRALKGRLTNLDVRNGESFTIQGAENFSTL